MENASFDLEELNRKAWSLRASDAAQGLELTHQVQTSLAQVEWNDMKPAEHKALVEALRTQAFCYCSIGQLDKALASGLRGLELAQRAGLFDCMAAIHLILSDIYCQLGDFTSSLDYNLKGLSILQDHPDQKMESWLKNCLGSVYSSMGNYQEAYKHCQAGFESAPPDEPLIRANALNNMGYNLNLMGQPEQALAYALKSVAEYDRANLWGGKSVALETLGSIYLALGQEEQAMESYQSGLELARHGQFRSQEIENLFGVARLQRSGGEPQVAMKTLLNILEISREIGYKQAEADANERLAEICKQQGDYPAALGYFEAFHTISMELSREKAERRLQQMQVQYEVESIRKQADQYRELATTDPLTGLLNRRRFFELAEQSLHTAQAEGLPLGVMMLDIDHFKQINDHYGHSFGDAVLAEVANRLRGSLRSDDWAGRYGGDELVVVLHIANCETARAIAMRIRQAIIHEAVSFGAARQEITVSLGVACADNSQELSLVELVDRADQALLQAKQSGRNRVMLYEPMQSSL